MRSPLPGLRVEAGGQIFTRSPTRHELSGPAQSREPVVNPQVNTFVVSNKHLLPAFQKAD
jgi:hypothetical protein